jgi:hypothetical protein
MPTRTHAAHCAKTLALRTGEQDSCPDPDVRHALSLSRSHCECDCQAKYEPGAREVNAKGCPCGGVILADTDSLRVPLCIDCHEEHADELAAGLLNDLRRSRVECARLAADVERLRGMSDKGLGESHSILWHALTRESDT